MKKSILFRTAVAALTLILLLPNLAVSGTKTTQIGAKNLYHYEATTGESSRTAFMNKTFPNNVVNMHGPSQIYRTFRQWAHTVYREDEVKYPVPAQGMQLGTDPGHTYSTDGRYSGRPSELVNGIISADRILENIWFELGGVEYPIFTWGLEALNISFDYMCGAFSLGQFDELQVKVSLDGETWLEDSVSIRSHKLLGATEASGSEFYMYHLETENLLDIEGLEPGDRIRNILVKPLDDDTTHGFEIHFVTLDLNGYSSLAEFERLVPADVREYVHVGEEIMRQIVVEEAVRTATLPWTTDSIIHCNTLGSDIIHTTDIPWQGCVYERATDVSRELFQSKVIDGKWMGGNAQDNNYGMDCQTFVFNASSRVSRAMAIACMFTPGAPGMSLLGEDFLTLPEKGMVTFTNYDVTRLNSAQDMFRSYALAKPGDHELVQSTNYDGTSTYNSHVRVVVENHTVYNDDGTIDGDKSYFVSAEQQMFPWYELELADGTQTTLKCNGVDHYEELQAFLAKNPGAKVLYGHSARANNVSTYNQQLMGDYVIYTCDYYKTGDIELENVETVIAPKTKGATIQEGGAMIALTSNYRMIGWGIKLEDMTTGELLFDDYVWDSSSYTFATQYTSEVLDTKMAALTNGNYRLSVYVDSGPFTALGQTKVPTTTKHYDFTVDTKQVDGQAKLDMPVSAAAGQTVDVAVQLPAAADAAAVEVKFDTDALTYAGAQCADTVAVQANGGIVKIMAVDAGVSAGGTLATLRFTANKAVDELKQTILLKSAAISTAQVANADAARVFTGSQALPSVNMYDVFVSSWYRGAVDYVLEQGIMSGYNASTFGPNDELSRAMVVQVLYNKEGQPAIDGTHKFPDVKSGDWFNNAVTWGVQKNVVGGYGDGRFGPNDSVTIEQIAVILWNYAGKPEGGDDLTDIGVHSDWAEEALHWAEDEDILSGVPYDTVTATATRAQTAQMLMNFQKK